MPGLKLEEVLETIRELERLGVLEKSGYNLCGPFDSKNRKGYYSGLNDYLPRAKWC